MMRARVVYQGRPHTAAPHPAGLLLDDGRALAEEEVVWLAPLVPRTIFAVGLNYAEHARELAFRPQTEPLVFLKGPRSVAGHRAATERPADAAFMHYECELAAVIGRAARRVPAGEALRYVAGYTIANDYAVRDYLENYYRPNLRAKSRDGATVLGPWLVDAADVPDPQALELRTRVNGKITQHGSTRDMIHGVAQLIEYLSSFLTLAPGDVILTGTPDGVCNVAVGDEVVTEIDGIGALRSFLTAGPSRVALGPPALHEVENHG
jgi:5-oxopent-3-ene-1,2,5-tricarboxylate decarboxylase / 2-hydroxyhepta-2,4-diene-1,7-dioate isomerase